MSVLQVDPAASLSASLAQTDYCRQQSFDPQSPLCAHVILSGSVVEVRVHALTCVQVMSEQPPDPPPSPRR